MEHSLFSELFKSSESIALRHLFQAERLASKVSSSAASEVSASNCIPAGAVRHVGVIGAGTMGAGIAACFLLGGFESVTLCERNEEALNSGASRVISILKRAAQKGRLPPGVTEQELVSRLVAASVGLDALSTSDCVVEAVFEDLELKKSVFRDLGRICRSDALLATNTSTLDISAIAAASDRPERVVGMHFFSPAHVMRLLEIVRCDGLTAQDAVEAASGLAKRIRKTGVVVGNCDGFVGNRMLAPYAREAALLLDEGMAPAAIDKAIASFGLAMGPFQMGDLAGNDVGWRIRKQRGLYDPKANAADRLCDMGRFGQKVGKGWYRYDPFVAGGRKPLPDPEVDALLAAHRRENGLAAPYALGPPPRDDVVKRCLLPLVNEGLRCLEEGIADRPEDIDVIKVLGYGFPPWRGGPIHWAEKQLGFATMLREMERFAAQREDLMKCDPLFRLRWTPCDLLREAAAAASGGTSLAELTKQRRARHRSKL